jgi:hypothetical protein
VQHLCATQNVGPVIERSFWRPRFLWDKDATGRSARCTHDSSDRPLCPAKCTSCPHMKLNPFSNTSPPSKRTAPRHLRPLETPSPSCPEERSRPPALVEATTKFCFRHYKQWPSQLAACTTAERIGTALADLSVRNTPHYDRSLTWLSCRWRRPKQRVPSTGRQLVLTAVGTGNKLIRRGYSFRYNKLIHRGESQVSNLIRDTNANNLR